ncbi:uncharacterized protein LOC115634502 [Scaptodrosophila lebanonensis]|uniref:Uncharacterized protein LOC115634502 n=1 Tax=Drosophila lebanonensis TaxID=7225 RepID=A0A6J2UI67_DROLE|nr:uncharacterized protein LOC115634502 [Scaptodrosophila lebanonensis]
MVWLVILVTFVVTLISYAVRQRHCYWLRRGIPHEKPSFPRGNFSDWPKREQFSTIFKKYYLKFKDSGSPFAGFYFFFTKTIVVTDIDLIKKVLIKDFNNFENRGIFYNEIDDPLSATLFSIEGHKWRHLRHKLTPTFTSGKMKNMFPIVLGVGEEMVKIFAEKVDGDSRVLEVTDVVGRYTADVIGTCAFGLDCNSLHNPKADFVTMGKRAILDRRYYGLLDFFMFGFPKLARRCHLKLNVQEVEDFYLGIVKDTIDYRLKNQVKRHDFMDMLIEMYQKHQNGNEEEGLSFEELAAQAFIFFVAGFETSSTTMGFALYELAQHQEIQNKVREEVAQVLAKNNSDFSYEAMKQMQYLEQVVMETLRKYPVLGHLSRVSNADYLLDDPKHYIQKGTVVVISALGVHYDPDIYPDPEKFQPERFTEENIASRPPCTWLPFGDGPRNCIGSRFGLMQTCIGLASLLKNYKFSTTPETQIPLKLVNKNILLSAENGIHLKVEKIRSKLLRLCVRVLSKMGVGGLLLTALVALLGYLFLRLRRNAQYWQNLGIACEEPHLLMGSLAGVRSKRSFMEIWTHYYNKFRGTGPFAGFYWFQRPAAFILEPFLAKHILVKDFNKFTDRGFFHNEEDDPLTGQLFLLDGHKWKSMRNKLSSTFTSGKMKYMFPTVVKVGYEFVEVFGDMVRKQSEIEVKELLARYTTDVIGTCAFGIECSSLKDPEAEFRLMGRRVFTDVRHGVLGLTFINSFPKLARRLHMKSTPQHIEDFFLRIVRETVTFREQNNIKRNDFMDQLIELKNNRMLKSETGESMNLTLEEVAAQAFVFFAAGFETSSTAMGFALYELAQNANIQQRARDEINEVLEKHNDELNYECMKELTYLDQIISETLRLYTVLPVLNRECLEDYVVPGYPKYVIKAGMPVLIPAGAMHRDEKLYPDPDTFNPDNFDPDRVKERDSVEWLPFGDGPRNCIGMRFGQMQARIGLALLLKNFRFSVCERTPIPMTYNLESFLIASEKGIYLRVEQI